MKVQVQYPDRAQLSGPVGLFCGAQTKDAGLMSVSGKVFTKYHELAAGLQAVLKRCLDEIDPGPSRFCAEPVWARTRLL